MKFSLTFAFNGGFEAEEVFRFKLAIFKTNLNCLIAFSINQTNFIQIFRNISLNLDIDEILKIFHFHFYSKNLKTSILNSELNIFQNHSFISHIYPIYSIFIIIYINLY